MMKIPLAKPIDGIIDVALETPTLAHLAGLNLASIAQGDVEQVVSLLIKLTPLTREQVCALELCDFTRLWREILSFLVDISLRD